MTIQELAALLDGLGVPWVNTAYEPDEAPPLPYIVLVGGDSDPQYADGIAWTDDAEYRIELYTKRRDYPLEHAIRDALDGAGLAYERYTAWIDAEKMQVAVFTVTVDD